MFFREDHRLGVAPVDETIERHEVEVAGCQAGGDQETPIALGVIVVATVRLAEGRGRDQSVVQASKMRAESTVVLPYVGKPFGRTTTSADAGIERVIHRREREQIFDR